MHSGTPILKKRSDIAAAFPCPGRYLGEHPYGSGHINDTYRVLFDDAGRETQYIRQRINPNVFPDIPALMENIGRVLRHLETKLDGPCDRAAERRILTLIPTIDGADYLQDANGDVWRTYVFVTDARGVDVIENTTQAFEAAKAFGTFQSQLADLPGRLHETIPQFHDTPSRYRDLLSAINDDNVNRAASARDEIAFARQHESLTTLIMDRIASGALPERVTHNDTKLNNVLLDTTSHRGVCVIDLDTVMPGSPLFDFGDMVRSMTTTATENEPDPSKIAMDATYFEAIVKGYLESAGGFLNTEEKSLLALSGPLITFEIGLRFLSDYLRGDTYFKTDHDTQNLDRCRKQFRMVQSMEAQSDLMQTIVERSL
ncbi:MAG: Ser/Thr protein kinase RdoA (MazF antagonist) [Kiritimatiellia bacterium]|jgi:Ser/Thr protein kinase RdoA (MazF antagonist)